MVKQLFTLSVYVSLFMRHPVSLWCIHFAALSAVNCNWYLFCSKTWWDRSDGSARVFYSARRQLPIYSSFQSDFASADAW